MVYHNLSCVARSKACESEGRINCVAYGALTRPELFLPNLDERTRHTLQLPASQNAGPCAESIHWM